MGLIQPWIDFALQFFTHQQWLIIISSLGVGWVITEWLKRSLVWKNDKVSRVVTFTVTVTDNIALQLKPAVVVGFVVTFVFFTGLWWAFQPNPIGGLLVGLVLGVLSPFLYWVLIALLRKVGLDTLADKITGADKQSGDT